MNAAPLIVRCGAFGDMVLLTPLIRLLAARHGRPVDLLSAGAWTVPLLGAMPELGRIQLLTSRNTPFALCPSQWAAVRWLRQRGRGPVYLCDVGDKIRELLSRAGVDADDVIDCLARPPEKAATLGTWPDLWIEVGMRDPPRHGATHPVADPTQYRFPRLPVDAGQRAELERWMRQQRIDGPLILFQPGNKRTHKRGKLGTLQQNKFWPPERWAQVAQAVLDAHPDGRVALCGSRLEYSVLEAIRHGCADHRVLNLSRELPVPRLIAMLERAHSMISVDTGPAHAAAALGCPLVVLFGAAPIELWRPLGPGAVRIVGGGSPSCRVDDIGAAAVIDHWRAVNLALGSSRDGALPTVPER
ncbi:MAG: glycosyltransferase family 9 protein [Rudaea sp.]|nr:glycosyltransferase family 9 protein [Rudaea sp.]